MYADYSYAQPSRYGLLYRLAVVHFGNGIELTRFYALAAQQLLVFHSGAAAQLSGYEGLLFKKLPREAAVQLPEALVIGGYYHKLVLEEAGKLAIGVLHSGARKGYIRLAAPYLLHSLQAVGVVQLVGYPRILPAEFREQLRQAVLCGHR